MMVIKLIIYLSCPVYCMLASLELQVTSLIVIINLPFFFSQQKHYLLTRIPSLLVLLPVPRRRLLSHPLVNQVQEKKAIRILVYRKVQQQGLPLLC